MAVDQQACRTCHAHVPESSAFCPGCGTAVAAPVSAPGLSVQLKAKPVVAPPAGFQEAAKAGHEKATQEWTAASTFHAQPPSPVYQAPRRNWGLHAITAAVVVATLAVIGGALAVVLSSQETAPLVPASASRAPETTTTTQAPEPTTTVVRPDPREDVPETPAPSAPPAADTADTPDTNPPAPQVDEAALAEEAVSRHWARIERGDLGTAFDAFGPDQRRRVSRERWISDLRADGLQSASVDSTATVTSSTTAIATVNLRTEASATGCKDWSGTYDLINEGGWRINRSDLNSRPC